MRASPPLSRFGEIFLSPAYFHHVCQCLVSGPGESFGENVCQVVFGFYVGELDVPLFLFVCVKVFHSDMLGLRLEHTGVNELQGSLVVAMD